MPFSALFIIHQIPRPGKVLPVASSVSSYAANTSTAPPAIIAIKEAGGSSRKKNAHTQLLTKIQDLLVMPSPRAVLVRHGRFRGLERVGGMMQQPTPRFLPFANTFENPVTLAN
jgi:hypothetical protein